MVSIFDDHQDLADVQHAFFYLDYLHNGTINHDELKQFFADIGAEHSDEEVDAIMQDLHLREKSLITYTEFVAAVVNPTFFYDDFHCRCSSNDLYFNPRDCRIIT